MNPISDAQAPDTDNDALRYGVVIRPPVYRLDARAFVCSQLLHVDHEALAGEGVTVVTDGNFVGVVAASHEAARRAAARLPLRWSTPDRDHKGARPAVTDARLRRDYQWPGRLAWGAEPDWVIADFIDGGLRLAGPVANTERLRGELPGLRAQLHCGGGSFKSRMKKADRSGARLALLLGEDELAEASATLKFLREERDQQSLPQAALAETLRELLA